MSVDMTQFYQVFFEETEEHLAEMEALLLGLDVADPNPDELNAIFRAAHSIKGGAGTFGFPDMADVTHVLESLLDKLRKGEIKLETQMIDAFLQAVDVIRNQLAAHRGEGEADSRDATAVCGVLESLSAKPQDECYGFFEEVDQGYGFFAEEPLDAKGYGFFEPESENQGYGFFEPPAEAKTELPVQKPKAPQTDASSIRVNVEKVDSLINLVGELVITESMLAQTASTLNPEAYEKLQASLAQLERNTRDLQESIMSIRMMPISFVFSRFPRVVRDLAAKLGKEVELRTEGEGTELDKGLIEKIADPLTHLVRNSLDHGIETPEIREASGKARCGTITLRAFHRGGNIVIEVSDDGAGLSRKKILEKAASRGIPVSESLSDQDVWHLIFEAGFSTAEVVTDVSGRGVGMDVVRRNIHEIGGRVEIDSSEGLGTRISISLPLTLAILDGMSIGVGEQILIIPLNCIVETLQPLRSEIKSVSGEKRLLGVRGEYIPLVLLSEIFNIASKSKELDQGIAVILESDGKKSALFVDELIGQHQVVIKSLESNYRKVQGISGATIMGDGKVALILDVSEILARDGKHKGGSI